MSLQLVMALDRSQCIMRLTFVCIDLRIAPDDVSSVTIGHVVFTPDTDVFTGVNSSVTSGQPRDD